MVKGIKVVSGKHSLDNRTQGSRVSAKEAFVVTPKHRFIM